MSVITSMTCNTGNEPGSEVDPPLDLGGAFNTLVGMATKRRTSKKSQPRSKTFTDSAHKSVEIAVDNGPMFGSASLQLVVDGSDCLSLNYFDGGRGDPMDDALADAVKLCDLLRHMGVAPGSVFVTQFGSQLY